MESCIRHKQPFLSRNNLQQHIHSLHSGRPYRCDSCGRSFGLRYRCAAHKLECGFRFECSQCRKLLPSSQALELHCRRTRHVTKSAREQLREARCVSMEAFDMKLRKRRETPPVPRREQTAPAPVSSLLVKQLLGSDRMLRHIRKRKCLRDMSTQTDAVPPVPDPFLFCEPLSLLSDTQTQTLATVSHTESVQTNLMLSLSTEHAEVQTLLSTDWGSPEWSLFSHSQSDTLFDLGTQTYESLLGQELGLIDSSVQTYF